MKMTKEQEQGFIKFWTLWPKRVAKADAMKAWTAVDPKEYPAIFEAVPCHFEQPNWKKDGMAYAPYPATWLRGKRWEDEVKTPEDRDIELLIESLQKNEFKPADIPEQLINRFRDMCEKARGTCMAPNPCNWIGFHHALVKGMITEAMLRSALMNAKKPEKK